MADEQDPMSVAHDLGPYDPANGFAEPPASSAYGADPTLFIELTGDQAAFPADSRAMIAALGADDLTTSTIRGLHFGGAIAAGEPTGKELAAAEIIAWLGKRHELTPPD